MPRSFAGMLLVPPDERCLLPRLELEAELQSDETNG